MALYKWTQAMVLTGFTLSVLSCSSEPVTPAEQSAPSANPAPTATPVLEKSLPLNIPSEKVPEQAKAAFERNSTQISAKAFSGKISTPFKDKDLPVELSDYEFSVGTDTDQDGAENERGKGFIEITGLGKHEIELDQEDYPVMDNQDDSLTLTDKTTGNQRTYRADQDLYNYSISDGNNTLEIKTNVDGTWQVNGEGAKTVAEVVQLAMKSPVLSEASVHGLASLYTLMKNQSSLGLKVEPTTLTPIDCSSNTETELQTKFGDPLPLLQAGLEALIEHNKGKN